MIKINKDYSAIPMSLFVPTEGNKGTVIGRNTHVKRLELITNRAYIDNSSYNNRYKYDDTKSSLEVIYNGKCAYCEQKIEQFHVEHYRPKKIYYWLAFSWDNLLVACHSCNGFKNDHFDVLGTRSDYDDSIKIDNINNLSSSYDLLEKPRMVNPEVDDPEGKIEFETDGSIKSNDDAFNYTIDKCKLDRNYLNDNRRKILDRFKENAESVFLEANSNEEQINGFRILVGQFVNDSKRVDNEFLAFRRYSIMNFWINDIIKQICSS